MHSIILGAVMVSNTKENNRTESFENALRDINCGSSIRKAGEKWGIPRSTLQDRLYGKRKARGRNTVLSKAEETQFAEWLIERAKRGFGVTKDEFLDSVEAFISKDKRSTDF